MIKKIAWETFKNTGDINTYLELKQIETIENKFEEKNVTNMQSKIETEKQLNNNIQAQDL